MASRSRAPTSPCSSRCRSSSACAAPRRATPQGELPLQTISALAFDEVSFAYTPGRPVLQDVSFSVEAGEAIGIVGPSGAGKSTLVQILLQLRAPAGGRYVINDVEVARFL